MSFSPPSALHLAGTYDLASLGELRADLMRAADTGAGDTLHLDLSGVEGGDVGFVQLLLSLQASLAARGVSLTAKGSDAACDLFRRAGARLPGIA